MSDDVKESDTKDTDPVLNTGDALNLRRLEVSDDPIQKIQDAIDDSNVQREEESSLKKMSLILNATSVDPRTNSFGWNLMVRPIVEDGKLVGYQALLTKPVDSFRLTEEMEIDESAPKARGKIEMRFDLDPDFFDFDTL